MRQREREYREEHVLELEDNREHLAVVEEKDLQPEPAQEG